jgi:hypothetical protein
MNALEWLRHLFVPHQTNNHKAKILHPSALALLVALFLIYQSGISFYLLVKPSVLGFASDITPEKVIELTNQRRLEMGLGPLVISNKLSEAAQMKAGDMFSFDYWAHISPSGRDPWDFFRLVGYRYLFAGENLARDFMDSTSVVEAWMNSPSHRENILNPKYNEIGVAVVNGTLNGVETTLVVQLFGTPTPAPAGSETQPQSVVSQPSLGQSSKVETEQQTAPVITSAPRSTASGKMVSPFSLTKIAAIFLLGLILGALVLDVVLVYRKKIVRLSGRNLAHLVFIGALLTTIILTVPGAVL